MKTLTTLSKKNQMITDPQKKVNEFVDFFSNIGTNNAKKMGNNNKRSHNNNINQNPKS